jgi:hypothetical protein
MKLEKKAWAITEEDYLEHPSIIYSESRGKAKAEHIRTSEGHLDWSEISTLKCRRLKSHDVYSQEKHESLVGVDTKLIYHLMHSLGVEVGGFCPDEFYRNYSAYSTKHERCEKLVELGLMENYKQFSSEVYSVTEKGKEAVKTLLLIKKG